MTVRKILIAPDKRLKQRSSPVDIVDDKIRLIVNDMFETMYAADGLGLAAIQIGIPIRIIVADVNNKNEKPNPLCLINPEILQISSNTMLHEEGCLSLPEQFERVERPSTVKIQYLDNEGKSCEIEATGVLSVCLQHEIDHLEGTLFVDHLSTLKRRIILRKLIKAKKIEGEVLGQPHHKK
ncbi:MAG: peptide deformylase [Rhodospirillaceae bacterium]|nr:peptide deformylase [Rhodospirillaceae bacterium]|tara:strand:+ start:2594 stop:3136 length:543 start_codon:yes stop_codon:yes gene_type:complete